MIERGEATEKTKIEKEEKTKGQTERNTNNKVSLWNKGNYCGNVCTPAVQIFVICPANSFSRLMITKHRITRQQSLLESLSTA